MELGSKEMMDGSYSHMWAPLLQSFIGLLELPEDESPLPDDHYIEVDDTPGYQAAYSQLAFANKNDHDPLHGVNDPRLHLAQNLYRLSVPYPGQLSPLLSTGLSAANRSYLQHYLDAVSMIYISTELLQRKIVCVYVCKLCLFFNITYCRK
jgi:exportin-2 (importin alpha re-exporter)